MEQFAEPTSDSGAVEDELVSHMSTPFLISCLEIVEDVTPRRLEDVLGRDSRMRGLVGILKMLSFGGCVAHAGVYTTGLGAQSVPTHLRRQMFSLTLLVKITF